jgi:hypothetical protein
MRKGGKLPMAEGIFMKASEVAKELGVSESYAYKLVRKLNKELEKTGCIVIAGRIDRKFFHEKLYGTKRISTILFMLYIRDKISLNNDSTLACKQTARLVAITL